MAERLAQPFDLTSDEPLLRCVTFALATELTQLTVWGHHVGGDAFAGWLFLERLSQVYRELQETDGAVRSPALEPSRGELGEHGPGQRQLAAQIAG